MFKKNKQKKQQSRETTFMYVFHCVCTNSALTEKANDLQ